jgi:hypothetical protein
MPECQNRIRAFNRFVTAMLVDSDRVRCVISNSRLRSSRCRIYSVYL